MVRVRFHTDPNGLGRGSPERIWAKRLADGRSFFELHNTPFYAKGVSYLDVVEASEDPECPGVFEYRRTISASGHSTYRILIARNSSAFALWWEKLGSLGCTYEYADHGTELLYAVDVPPAVNIFEAYAILEDGENQSIWDFDEGHCGHSTNKKEVK